MRHIAIIALFWMLCDQGIIVNPPSINPAPDEREAYYHIDPGRSVT